MKDSSPSAPPSIPVMGPTGDWTPEQLEEAGRRVLETVRRHLEGLEETPVLPDVGARDLMELLDDPLPQQPEDFDDILQDTEEKVIPHLTQWNHPRFFAYFPVGSSGPGAAADFLASALNINGMLWKTAPAAVTLEQVVLRWMADMAGYDPDAEGTLINGASLATFYALAAAREAAGLNIREAGMTGRDLPRLRVYCSEHAHSSIDKAVIAVGVGLDNLVKIPTDGTHRLDPRKLDEAMAQDAARGYKPMAVVGVVGTTSTGAVDPVEDVAEVCRKHGAWLHVDAAFGGFYNIVPQVREKVGSLAAADSLVVNPHKVLFTPLETTAFYCRRKGALADAFSLVPPYLRTADEDGVVNPMDFTLQLGRRFNALKVWWVIRAFGVQGLRSRMEHQLALTRRLHRAMAKHPDFQTLDRWTDHQTPYPLLCFRAFPGEWPGDVPPEALARFNEALMERVNEDGRHFISHTEVAEGYLLRVSVGNIRTDESHVDSLWDALQRGVAGLSKKVEDWL